MQILDFLTLKGLAYTDTQNSYDKLLNICDAKDFLKIAEEEHVPIIGADIYKKNDNNVYSMDDTFDLSWSCECIVGEDITYKCYFDRSIRMAKRGLNNVSDRMRKNKTNLYINYVIPSLS